MTTMPVFLVFVVGACLGVGISAIIMAISTYLDYTSESKRAKERYTCHCDTNEDAYELIQLVTAHGGENIILDVYHNDYRISFKCKPDEAAMVVAKWMCVDKEDK